MAVALNRFGNPFTRILYLRYSVRRAEIPDVETSLEHWPMWAQQERPALATMIGAPRTQVNYSHSDAAGTEIDETNADGLLVFRVLTLAFGRNAIIFHLSVTEEEWQHAFYQNLGDIKRQIFEDLPVSIFLLSSRDSRSTQSFTFVPEGLAFSSA